MFGLSFEIYISCLFSICVAGGKEIVLINTYQIFIKYFTILLAVCNLYTKFINMYM